jgi:hypothetical protein
MAERALITAPTKLLGVPDLSREFGVEDISGRGQRKRGRGSGVRNILIESRETQATYSHIITYHSMRVDAKMIERGVPHIVVPPGNSWALFAVFA